MDIKKIIREELENPLNWMDNIKPMSPSLVWLKDNFNNLTKTIHNNHRIYYGLTPNSTILYYDETNPADEIYVSYDKIWSVLESRFHLSYDEIREVIKKWLSQDYNLTGLNPHF